MADMEFSEAYQEVAGRLGLSHTDSNTLTRVKRWLNLAYDDIVGFFEWSWLESREAVALAPDYDSDDDDLTVSITAGASTITFSDAIAVSRTGWYIQFSSADDWYRITAHTAAAATATIDPAYAQADNLSAGTFTIRKFDYSMSSAAEYIDSCRQAVSNIPVTVEHAKDYDKKGFPDDTGSPAKVVFWGQDSSGNWLFTPFPIPDTPMLLEFRIIKKNTALSADSDKAIFPRRFVSVWLDIATMYGYEFLNDSAMYGLKYSKNFGKNGVLQKLADKDGQDLDYAPVLETCDSGGGGGGFIPFPPEYER